MARKTPQIVGRGHRARLVRVYNGRDPETQTRKYLNQTRRDTFQIPVTSARVGGDGRRRRAAWCWYPFSLRFRYILSAPPRLSPE